MNNLKIFILLIVGVFALSGCKEEEPEGNIVDIILSDSEALPENLVAFDELSGMRAQYIYPTTRYNHGILGDNIEGGGLLINIKQEQFFFSLDTFLVFEDLQPRLVDFDNDGIPEIITILTNISKGASVSIFKFNDGVLSTYATSGHIGTPYRWLNIAAIDDLDDDGTLEIAFVSTPHIGGHLHIGHIDGSLIRVYTQQSGVSNHKIGSRNLCLSAITVSEGVKTLYLPSDEYDKILGFQWENLLLVPTDTIDFAVDPFIPLSEQYDFEGLQEDPFCINGE